MIFLSGTHFSLRLDALSLSLGGLSDGPTAPELEADPAVGVAHGDHGQEVGDDHEGHIVPRHDPINAKNCKLHVYLP